MGLHDRLKTTNGNGSFATAELAGHPSGEVAQDSAAHDPYSELKTRIHHACISTLGAELFKREATGDLTERVTRAVTEQLVLDRTPLTRDERRQIIREITDDILGYGPLEPFLRDDSVTGGTGRSSGRRPRSPTTRTCSGSSTRSSRRSAGAWTRPPRWWTPAFRTVRV